MIEEYETLKKAIAGYIIMGLSDHDSKRVTVGLIKRHLDSLFEEIYVASLSEIKEKNDEG